MKVINVGLSILISMGLAISPIQANEIDVADETNEEGVVNTDDTAVSESEDNEEFSFITVEIDAKNSTFTLDENETKNIHFTVKGLNRNKEWVEVKDFEYWFSYKSDNISLSNSKGSFDRDEKQSALDGDMMVTKTSRGLGRLSLNIDAHGKATYIDYYFAGTKLVTATFDTLDGSFSDGSKTCKLQAEPDFIIATLSVVAPDGCEFIGWYDENGISIHDHDLNEDTIFYAKYEKVFNVTFEAGLGHFDDGSTSYVEVKRESMSLNQPHLNTPEGYSFDGWFDADGNSPWEVTIDKDTTFYARYTKLVTVTFDAGEGTFDNGTHSYTTQMLPNEGSVAGLVPKAPDGLSFVGWFDVHGTRVEDLEISEDVTVYARYGASINVTFDAGKGHFQDGDTLCVMETAVGNGVSCVDPIAPNGYMFDGWYDENGNTPWEAPYDQDTTFYARYTKLVTVTFDAGEGTFDNGQKTITAEFLENSNPSYQEPIGPEGKVFVGWYDANGNSINGYTLTEDTTFYARYSKAITITFDAKEGNFVGGEKKQILKTGEGKFVYPEYVIAPEGLIFDGWYDADGKSNYDYDFKKDTTFYARYKKAIKITLDANGGTGDPIQYTIGQGSYQYFDVNNINFVHPDGKMLVGFKDKKTGKKYELGNGYQFDEDATLLAQWADPITITYDYNGGTSTLGNSYEETVGKGQKARNINGIRYAPNLVGKIFTGWHIGSVDGPKLDVYNYTFNADTVLVAAYADPVLVNVNLDALGMEPTNFVIAKGSETSVQSHVNLNIPEDKELIGFMVDGTNRMLYPYATYNFDDITSITAVIKDKIKVTYDSNGAGYPSQEGYITAQNFSITNVFNQSPKGKYFYGWAVGSPDGPVYHSLVERPDFESGTTLYAVWKDGYTITFDLSEGGNIYFYNENVFSKYYSFYLGNIHVQEAPQGKALVGWRINDNSKVLGLQDYFVLTKDTVLHPVWEDTVTISVRNPETNEVLYTSDIAKGTTFNDTYPMTNYLLEGQCVSGWTLDKDTNSPIDIDKVKFDKNTDLYPIIGSKVKLHIDWGQDCSGMISNTETDTMEVNAGERINGFNVEVNKSPKGKVLAGFKVDGTDTVFLVHDSSYVNTQEYKIYKDTTLHAIWEDGYHIALDANGEIFESGNKQMKFTALKDSVYNYVQLLYQSYNQDYSKVVSAWTINSADGPVLENKPQYVFDADTTYYAVWQDAQSYKFEYNNQIVATFNNSYYSKNMLPLILRNVSSYVDFDDGEVFVGWYNKETGEKLTDASQLDKSCTYIAKTIKKSVKVTFDYNGGKGGLTEVEAKGGFISNDLLKDPLVEAPKGKLFVGWSLTKDGKVIKSDIDSVYFDKDTTLYAKYGDTITLTFHENGETYQQEVLKDTPISFIPGFDYVINGKKVYAGQNVQFSKDTDVYMEESKVTSTVIVCSGVNANDFNYRFGYFESALVSYANSSAYQVQAPEGEVINLSFEDEFIPEGMEFDRWVSSTNVDIKDPTNQHTTFVMPKMGTGATTYIFATFKKASNIQFEKDSVELTKGERSQLKVKGDYETLTWSSSDPTTVQVDQSGNIHAVKSGKATIRATDQKGKRIECVVTVTNKLKNLALSENKLELKGKTDKKLSVTLTPSDADDEKLSWSSSDEKVVKVSNDGTVTTVSCGEATITVKSESGLTDRCKVTVSHDWKLDSKVDATVDKEGKKVYKCTLCHETKEETIPKLSGKWITDSNGKWYQYSDGTFEKSGFKEINGKTYYFQNNGYVKTGKLVLDKDTYMFDADGVMVTGWYGNYYFEKDGKMKTNAFVDDYYLGDDGQYVTSHWIHVDGKDYYMNAAGQMTQNAWQGAYYLGKDGVMVKNDFTPDGFYCGKDGVYLTSQWFKHGGKDYSVNSAGKVVKNAWQGAYYLGSDGAMVKEDFTPDGFYCGKDGAYLTNQKVTVSGKDYYLNAAGTLAKNQWAGDYYVDSNNNPFKEKWAGSYYLGPDGKYVKNQFTPDGYYCGADGVYVTNRWIVVDGKDYYMNAYGKMTTEAWQGAYYLGKDGVMVKNDFTPDGYYVGANGAYLTSQWFKHGGKDYYVNGSGLVVKNAWVGSYYLGSDGVMATSSWVDNNQYYVNENGLYVAGRWVQYGSRWCYYAGNVYAKNITLNINGKAYTFDSNGYMK